MDQRDFDLALREMIDNSGLSFSEKGPSLIVAVSGGVDSMVLAHLCLHSSMCLHSRSDTQSVLGFRIIVAHCNFHLRGEESDGDEALVRAWCAVNGIEIHVADFDTAFYAREHGLSIEMAARELRYSWFARLCRDTSSLAVLVAHNANDNAETLFLNLLRGTGLRGLCGMRPASVIPTDSSVPLLRPLLSFTREEIERYARFNRIHWREDSTNADSNYRRNLIRNEIFPLLHTTNASFVETLNREMRYFSEANAILDESIPDLFKNNIINIEELLSHKHWPYILYTLLKPYGFNGATIENIEILLRKASVGPRGLNYRKGFSGSTFLSNTHIVYTTGKELVLMNKESLSQFTEITIEGPGTYKVDPRTYTIELFSHNASWDYKEKDRFEKGSATSEGRTIVVEVIDRQNISNLKAPKGIVYLDADMMPFPFKVRSWKYGDWIRPFGMGGKRKKISDLFTDLQYDMVDKSGALFITKTSDDRSSRFVKFGEKGVRFNLAPEKRSIPFLEENHVFSLLGERIDEAVKVTPATTKVLKITLL